MNSAETTHEHGVQTHENNLSAKTCSLKRTQSINSLLRSTSFIIRSKYDEKLKRKLTVYRHLLSREHGRDLYDDSWFSTVCLAPNVPQSKSVRSCIHSRVPT